MMEVLSNGALLVTQAGDFVVDGELYGFVSRGDRPYQIEVRRGVGPEGPMLLTCLLVPPCGQYALPHGAVAKGVFSVKVTELVTEPTRR